MAGVELIDFAIADLAKREPEEGRPYYEALLAVSGDETVIADTRRGSWFLKDADEDGTLHPLKPVVAEELQEAVKSMERRRRRS